jgi:hypothetical protein
MPNKTMLKAVLVLILALCAALVYSQTIAKKNQADSQKNTQINNPEKKGSNMTNAASPNSFSIIHEKVATEKYALKTQMRDLFDSWIYESHLKNYFFLVADGDIAIDGDLRLDYNDDDWATDAIDWRKELNIADDENLKNNYGIRGVIVTGNLTVNGSIVNSDMNDGAFLLVMGNVTAHNLVAGGAHMVIKGNANARDVAYGHYNDGSIQINGDLSAPIFINEDHDFGFNALKNNQFKYDFNDDDSDEDDDGNPIIPSKLRALLDDDIKNWADLTKSLRSGEYVLKKRVK